MRIDLKTLTRVTKEFLDSEGTTMTFPQLRDALSDVTEEHLAWYLDLLHDDTYVIREDRKSGIGVTRCGNGGLIVSTLRLRLTSQGIDFASTLNRPDAIKWVEKSAKGAYLSLDVISRALQGWIAAGFPVP